MIIFFFELQQEFTEFANSQSVIVSAKKDVLLRDKIVRESAEFRLFSFLLMEFHVTDSLQP